MESIALLSLDSLQRGFVPSEFLHQGDDEYTFRNRQSKWPQSRWRHLRAYEIEQLVKNNNQAGDWDDVLVTDPFDPTLIVNNRFFGLVRLGRVQPVVLEHHELLTPAGISNSLILSCDIGDDCAIHNVHYLAHYIIGDRCILLNIDEMHTTNHAKFGNGIIKEGEPEEVRVWLDLMNETGSRRVMPFDGMLAADAYLWAKYRDDRELLAQLKEITQKSFDARRGYYGTVGDQTVIKNSLILKDVKIGDHCYIKGANKLKNLTINSSEDEPTQIGEGVEMVNGIVGYGCHIFYGCKAVRFIMGDNSNLKYGARLINSYLGDNSTVSCCEVLNNLIFPSHEQHHNNSFLIASVVLGQSNIAAGATIGSNHNSRANDNEVQAGRGFWPGLCTSIKHSSRFASFVLLSKGDYPAELNIPLPFSLLNNNVAKDQLEVLPAYWWLYNMYALARNAWKYRSRDKRKRKLQHIEFDCLAPDTVEEIFEARRLLEIWTAKSKLQNSGEAYGKTDEDFQEIGRQLLNGPSEALRGVTVLGEEMEKSNRRVVILKAQKGYQAYKDMLWYYAVKNLIDYLQSRPKESWETMKQALAGERVSRWVNLGGQLMPEQEVDRLRKDIADGVLKDWQAIHRRYDELWEAYPLEKQKHAFAVLCELLQNQNPTLEQWFLALDKAEQVQSFICDQVYLSRKKDYDNPFRRATYRNDEEMVAALGTIEENSFIQQVREETREFAQTIARIKSRG
ncbi:MAG: DUF4954 family protein [candidate division KSB1 bacterium]|nr:DUF4954 family protein [candidate division KSB1 bacterium]